MKPTIFRCPSTGFRVQTLLDADADENDEGGLSDDYESVTCTACGRVHLVGRLTGRVLGATEPPGWR